MEISWTEFKKVVDARNLSIQYVELGSNYWLKILDGLFNLECLIPLDAAHEDTAVFIASYKAKGNIQPAVSNNAFAAKTVGNKKLYKRVHGIQQAITTGSTDIVWACPYPWAKFMAIEITNGQIGDTVSLYVLDKHVSPIYGVPDQVLNQFGFNTNISEKFYRRDSEFDADLYQDLQIKMAYSSISDKTIGINFIVNEVKS